MGKQSINSNSNLVKTITLDETVWTIYPNGTCINSEQYVLNLLHISENDRQVVSDHIIEALHEHYSK